MAYFFYETLQKKDSEHCMFKQGAPYVFERFSEAVLRPWVDVEMKCYHILLTQVYTFQIP